MKDFFYFLGLVFTLIGYGIVLCVFGVIFLGVMFLGGGQGRGLR